MDQEFSPDTGAEEPRKPADSWWKIVPMALLFGWFSLLYYGIKNRRRGHGRGNALLGIAGGMVVLAVIIGATIAATAPTTTPVAAASKASAPAQTNPVNPTPAPDPAPVREDVDDSGKFTSSCDMQMPEDALSGDYSFYANAKLHATGNVGLVVKVVAVFDQTQSENVVMRKTLHVPLHHTRTVKLHVPVTQNMVDQFQGSPDYFESKACRVHATVVDTYGLPPYEDS